MRRCRKQRRKRIERSGYDHRAIQPGGGARLVPCGARPAFHRPICITKATREHVRCQFRVRPALLGADRDGVRHHSTKKPSARFHGRAWMIVRIGRDYSAAAGSSSVFPAAFFLAAFFAGLATSAASSSTTSSAPSAGRSTHSMIAIGAESVMRWPSFVMRQ